MVPSEELRTFSLVPLVADFLRKKKGSVIVESGDRIEKHAYILVVENGYSHYDRYPELDTKWPMVAAALSRFLAGPIEQLQTVCGALSNFLEFTGRWDEWLALERDAEKRAVAVKDFLHAGWRAYQLGWIYYLRGQSAEVLACADQVESYWHEAEGKVGVRERASTIYLRGAGHRLAEDYASAILAFREVTELFRSLGSESDDVALALNSLADTERLSGDLDAAERYYREALRLRGTSPEGLAISTANLVALALDRKDWASAEVLAREALCLSEKLNYLELIGGVCQWLAEALLRQDKKEEAFATAQRAVEIFTQIGSPRLASACETLAQCER